MPNFNFKFTPVQREKKDKVVKVKEPKERKPKKEVIVDKKIKGVVFIDINGEYYVKVENKNYNINPSNYTCKNHTFVYYQLLDKSLKLTAIARNIDDAKELDNLLWLPFVTGCTVSGNIIKVKDSDINLFDIVEVFRDNKLFINDEAFKFHKDNNDILRTIKLNQIRNRCE